MLQVAEFGPINELVPTLASIIKRHRGEDYLIQDVEKNSSLTEFISKLDPNIFFVIEYPYVDRVYRDSYYSYFASKLLKYSRNSFKVSLFSGEPQMELFNDAKGHLSLQEIYLGFFTIRPTPPWLIGRTILSPRALTNHSFECCTVGIESSCYNVKLKSIGFPYASQDTESMSCAETSIWATMEYFGSKYPDYAPVLPSKIHKVLNRQTAERQLPTPGLDENKISFALKRFGFGTRIYGSHAYSSNGTDDLEDLVDIYVRSGIPTIVVISSDDIRHAYILIGKSLDESGVERKGKYIAIDDNHPPYVEIDIDNPGGHYTDHPSWQKCKLDLIITPLYKRVYFEAFEARAFIKRFVKGRPLGFDISGLQMCLHLASSRSYKDYLIQESSLDPDCRDLLLATPMPKFVWVGELSESNSSDVSAIVLLDATEPNTAGPNFTPLLAFGYKEVVMIRGGNQFKSFYVDLHPFRGHRNLQSF